MSAKRRRAPRGYRRMDPQVFNLQLDGVSLPPIHVDVFMNKSTGAVMAHRDTVPMDYASMDEFRSAWAKYLRSQHGFAPLTRHIAVVAVSGRGLYRLIFWPVKRRLAMDGTQWWAEHAHWSTGGLRAAADMWWDWHSGWSESAPSRWHETRYEAAILDWSCGAWDTLCTVRRQLDEAMNQIATLVTTPKLLQARTDQRLLEANNEQEEDQET